MAEVSTKLTFAEYGYKTNLNSYAYKGFEYFN